MLDLALINLEKGADVNRLAEMKQTCKIYVAH